MSEPVKRPELPEGEALAAAMLVSKQLWNQTYRRGEGPLHYAGGPTHRRRLLAKADELERLARAARVVAGYLPDGEDFFDVPARRGERVGDYRLWVNAESTLLVRQWSTGEVEIAERDDPSMTWGPPVQSSTLPSWIDNLIEEKV